MGILFRVRRREKSFVRGRPPGGALGGLGPPRDPFRGGTSFFRREDPAASKRALGLTLRPFQATVPGIADGA